MSNQQNNWKIIRAEKKDARSLGVLAAKMWDHPAAELAAEFEELLSQREAACFLCRSGDKDVGFAQCQLRHDYVEGTEGSPVGYLEGVYIEPEYRLQGCARALLAACEKWAKEMGCREFASDCELENRESLTFHLHVGFAEANRIICFVKAL